MTALSRPVGISALVVLSGLAVGVTLLPRAGNSAARLSAPPARRQAPALEVRMGFEQLRNPYWYEAKGPRAEARAFWDKGHWERVLKGWADDGYNALLYWAEPWTQTAWPSFLIRHE